MEKSQTRPSEEHSGQQASVHLSSSLTDQSLSLSLCCSISSLSLLLPFLSTLQQQEQLLFSFSQPNSFLFFLSLSLSLNLSLSCLSFFLLTPSTLRSMTLSVNIYDHHIKCAVELSIEGQKEGTKQRESKMQPHGANPKDRMLVSLSSLSYFLSYILSLFSFQFLRFVFSSSTPIFCTIPFDLKPTASKS